MIDQPTDAPAGDIDIKDDIAGAGRRLNEERQAFSEIGDAREAVVAGATDLGNQAVSRIGAEAEGIKEEAAADLTAFSDALKAASAQLSGKELGFAGDMLQQAAGGLETLARSLQDLSPGEMLETVRSFGRQNPVGFIAGSILAGFALGRVATTFPSHASAAAGMDEIRGQSAQPSGASVLAPAPPVLGNNLPGGMER